MKDSNFDHLWLPWMLQARQDLERYADQLNAMNVFPVADSDTGSNMLATISAACQSQPRAGVQAAYRQAQGNSGMILSAWLGALTTSLGPSAQLTPEALHLALWQAAAQARQSLEKPVEGTILAAMDAVAQAPLLPELDQHLLHLAYRAAQAVAASEQLLAAAQAAATKDAGAAGFFLVMNALSLSYSGLGVSDQDYADLFKAADPSEQLKTESDKGFELMCQLELEAALMAQLRADLAGYDSLSVVCLGELEQGQVPTEWGIHLHTTKVEQALARIQAYGSPKNLRINPLFSGQEQLGSGCESG